MKQWFPQLARALSLLLLAGAVSSGFARDSGFRGAQFLAFDSWGKFTALPGAAPGETVLLSRRITTRIPWNELILSWNAETPAGSYLKIGVCGIISNRLTSFYNLGEWSSDPVQHPRTSVPNQRDADGEVKTDTLVLLRHADGLRLRVTLGGGGSAPARLRFLGVSLLDSTAVTEPLPPNRAAWGRELAVPERSQMAYAEGGAWCSPTTISMLLAHWSARLDRPELNQDVPVVAAGVHDPNWGGTGNWVFNTAYAGSFAGMRAYTTRLSDVAELEDWIAHGMPVGLSVCYNRLRACGTQPSGHLVVCVGFTSTGDVIVNDPGTRINVRKVFPRAQLLDAWKYSARTVYLVYPCGTRLPPNRFRHWE